MNKDKKKKKTETIVAKPIARKDDLGMNYLKSLDNESKYETEVDPDGFYDMCSEHKQFVRLYVEHKHLPKVADIMMIEPNIARDYFTRYSTQQEIRRINAAIYHRQVATNIIAFEDIGSYLSSWLIGQDITAADELKKSEKLQVVKLLLDWHKSMREFVAKPEIITMQTIEEEIKELGVADIKRMLSTKKTLMSGNKADTHVKESVDLPKDKSVLLEQVEHKDSLTKEELEYLESLSSSELIQLLKEEG